ncbi:MAG: GGDEF domain-containing protein [Myxococcota bacterium]|jgi:diguanylate cyclase (GGDEF)-like protein|nr:GGDEF domain-containing protein [Myxococcota bacterium]
MYEPDDIESKTRVTDALTFEPPESHQDALVHIYPPGTDMGRKHELSPKMMTIGRDQANNIVINSDSVSRRHARLTIEGRKRVVTDLQSTNGTYVNNRQILSQELENGDQIKIGDTIFKYLMGNDVESAYHEEIYRMTIKDGLTEIYNKRYFLEALEREMSRAQRYQRPLSMLMFDVDFFKRINDKYGHLAGDYVLQALARVISTRSRREEIFARYGGEEFAILLPETNAEGALELADQLRQRVAGYTFIFEGEEIPVTVSIGVADTCGDPLTPNELIQKADAKMYQAKGDGRNCVRG